MILAARRNPRYLGISSGNEIYKSLDCLKMFSDCRRGSKRVNHNDTDSDNFMTMKIYNTAILASIGVSSDTVILYQNKKVGGMGMMYHPEIRDLRYWKTCLREEGKRES